MLALSAVLMLARTASRKHPYDIKYHLNPNNAPLDPDILPTVSSYRYKSRNSLSNFPRTIQDTAPRCMFEIRYYLLDRGIELSREIPRFGFPTVLLPVSALKHTSNHLQVYTPSNLSKCSWKCLENQFLSDDYPTDIQRKAQMLKQE
jgi:hypothetical protein